MYSGFYSSGILSLPNSPYSYPRYVMQSLWDVRKTYADPATYSGNCTWPPFPTLGVSIQCFDDSARFHLNCSNPDLKPRFGYNYTACAIEEKNPLDRLSPPSQYDVFKGRGAFRMVSLSYHSERLGNLTMNPLTNGCTDYEWQLAKDIMAPPWVTASQSVITPNTTFEAGAYLFYISMQTLRAEAHNGIYTERVLNSISEGTFRPRRGDADDKQDLSYQYTPRCSDFGQSVPCSSDTLVPVELNITKRLSQDVLAEIDRMLPNDNYSVTASEGLNTGAETDSHLSEAITLFRSPNITKTMHAIAHYMTVALRANDNPDEVKGHDKNQRTVRLLFTTICANRYELPSSLSLPHRRKHLSHSLLANAQRSPRIRHLLLTRQVDNRQIQDIRRHHLPDRMCDQTDGPSNLMLLFDLR
jgi:hypothetical protein